MREKRDRLFRSGRPLVRKLKIIEGDKYHRDVGILWIAYQKKPFEWMQKGLNQEQFARSLSEDELYVIEDKNRHFKSGTGIVTLMLQYYDGWKLEPHAEHMPWATNRNKLKSIVAYLQYVRYLKSVGACIVYTLKDHEKFFDKCCDYGVLHRVGNIVNGAPKGDVVVFSVRGKKHVDIGSVQQAERKAESNV